MKSTKTNAMKNAAKFFLLFVVATPILCAVSLLVAP